MEKTETVTESRHLPMRLEAASLPAAAPSTGAALTTGAAAATGAAETQKEAADSESGRKLILLTFCNFAWI